MTILNTKWVNCKSCGHRYADWVKACPRCHYTNPKRVQKQIAIGAVVSVIGVAIAYLFLSGSFTAFTQAPITGQPVSGLPKIEVPKIDIPKVELPKPISNEERAEQLAKDIFNIVNEERTNAGLRPVAWDNTLANAGILHAKDMAERDYFEHDTPEGVTPDQRARALGFNKACPAPYYGVAENILMGGPSSAEETMDTWMDSQGHRANIMTPTHYLLGVGVYYTDNGYMYAVQEFC